MTSLLIPFHSVKEKYTPLNVGMITTIVKANKAGPTNSQYHNLERFINSPFYLNIIIVYASNNQPGYILHLEECKQLLDFIME
jgi:hypothetical protein